jgi:FkbM family methyltransferase
MKRMIQSLLRPMGYRLQDMRKIGRDPWRDVEILLQPNRAPVCFDVGAHRGETIRSIVELFPKASIHAFEPDPDNFAALQDATRDLPQARLRLYSLALGDCPGQAKLQKTFFSMTHSLLPAATLNSPAHKKIGEVEITVTTLDLFCQREKIEAIDLLKIDCQGFDLRVLHGAGKMLSERRIKVIQCESLFAAEYEGQGWFYDLLHFLTDLGYAPVSFGDPARNECHEIIWSDVIFKCRDLTPA